MHTLKVYQRFRRLTQISDGNLWNCSIALLLSCSVFMWATSSLKALPFTALHCVLFLSGSHLDRNTDFFFAERRRRWMSKLFGGTIIMFQVGKGTIQKRIISKRHYQQKKKFLSLNYVDDARYNPLSLSHDVFSVSLKERITENCVIVWDVHCAIRDSRIHPTLTRLEGCFVFWFSSRWQNFYLVEFFLWFPLIWSVQHLVALCCGSPVYNAPPVASKPSKIPYHGELFPHFPRYCRAADMGACFWQTRMCLLPINNRLTSLATPFTKTLLNVFVQSKYMVSWYQSSAGSSVPSMALHGILDLHSECSWDLIEDRKLFHI